MRKRTKHILFGLGATTFVGSALAFGYLTLRKHIDKQLAQKQSVSTSDEVSLSVFDQLLITTLENDIRSICTSHDTFSALLTLVTSFKKLTSKDPTHAESALESFCWLCIPKLEALLAHKKELMLLRLDVSAANVVFVSPNSPAQGGPIIIKSNGKDSIADLIAQAIQGPNSGLLQSVAYQLEAALIELNYAISYVKADPKVTLPELIDSFLELLDETLQTNWHPLTDEIAPIQGEVKGGEWQLRRALSEAVYSGIFPIHPQAHFQVNAHDGNVAIELELVPEDALLTNLSALSPALKHTKLQAKHSRQKLSSKLTLDMGLWLANIAFRCSDNIQHVWLIIKHYKAANHHSLTLLTCDFDRYRFAKITRLTTPVNYESLMRSFAADIRLKDGILRPIAPTTTIQDARFFPPRRQEPLSLKVQPLAAASQKKLGAKHAGELSIEEADTRVYIANQILSRLIDDSDSHAIEKNVRAILDITSKVSDPEIVSAAKRTISGLIDGTVDATPEAIGNYFVAGDALSQAVFSSRQHMRNSDFEAAINSIAPELAQVDTHKTFEDTQSIEWRFFSDFAGRALYNRLNRSLDKAVMLVPDAYFEAHFTLSQAYAMVGDTERALIHARRLYELAPMDAIAALNLAGILRQHQNPHQAALLIESALQFAHNAISLGLLYFQLGLASWELGELRLAQAAMVVSTRFIPHAPADMTSAMAQLTQELETMGEKPDRGPTLEDEGTRIARMELPQSKLPTLSEAKEILRSSGIPDAPSKQITQRLADGLAAAADEELFDVAKSFARSLISFTHDPVLAHIASSLDTK